MMRGGKSSFLFLLWPWTTSAEWSEGPSAAAGGAGSKRRRTGDSDDSDDGEDAAVSAQLGARLSMPGARNYTGDTRVVWS